MAGIDGPPLPTSRTPARIAWLGRPVTTSQLRKLALTAMGLAWLTGCSVLEYGANFDYPPEPPTPPGATVVASADGSDDDDPMRGRQVVLDIGNTSTTALVKFYGDRFPTAEGWAEGTALPDVGGGHLLCLVSQSHRDFDEYVEIYPHQGDDKSAGPHRYRVSISRLYVSPEWDERTVDRCGLAARWFPW